MANSQTTPDVLPFLSQDRVADLVTSERFSQLQNNPEWEECGKTRDSDLSSQNHLVESELRRNVPPDNLRWGLDSSQSQLVLFRRKNNVTDTAATFSAQVKEQLGGPEK